jgi:hypothetical protein
LKFVVNAKGKGQKVEHDCQQSDRPIHWINAQKTIEIKIAEVAVGSSILQNVGNQETRDQIKTLQGRFAADEHMASRVREYHG